MGLDMYLKKGKRIPKMPYEKYKQLNNEINDSKLLQLKYRKYVQTCGEHIHWKALTKEVGYWRKANAIHKFFVDNVQKGYDDCDEYMVTKATLKNLLSICNRIKAQCKLVPGKVIVSYSYNDKGEKVPNYKDGLVIDKPEIPAVLLPTQDGFFFGNTEYNEYYMEDINYTIELIEKILEETDFRKYYITYTSSW